MSWWLGILLFFMAMALLKASIDIHMLERDYKKLKEEMERQDLWNEYTDEGLKILRKDLKYFIGELEKRIANSEYTKEDRK